MKFRKKKLLPFSRRILMVSAVASAPFLLSGCRAASDMATKALAGKTVADDISDKGSHEKTSIVAMAESKRQNSDPRIGLGLHLQTSWLEFRTQPRQMKAQQSTIWTLNVWQAGKIAKNRNWVEDFKYSHEKLMHLIVVSKDFSYFNHLHPEYRGDGLFITSETLPIGGNYKIYADYTPQRGAQEVAQHEFRVLENAPNSAQNSTSKSSASAKLVADKIVDGWMKRSVVSKPEGQPEADGGETYNVALMPMPERVVVGKMSMLHFRVSDAQNRPLTDLQPYLGAMGHAVILSEDSKIYLHTHPMDSAEGGAHDMNNMNESASENADSPESSTQSGGPDVIFHTQFPAAGLYKIWAQFQHKGRIITAPFVVNVAAK